MRPLATVVALVLMLATGTTDAHAAQQPGASCANTSSAINQYCENIPSATGVSPPPGGPGPVAPTLGAALPLSAVHTYQHLAAATRKRGRKLLSLPAPAAPVPVGASISTNQGAWSLRTGLVLAMIVIAAACAAVALARRRRGRAG